MTEAKDWITAQPKASEMTPEQMRQRIAELEDGLRWIKGEASGENNDPELLLLNIREHARHGLPPLTYRGKP